MTSSMSPEKASDLRLVVVDGGALAAEEVLGTLRSAGFRVSAERVAPDEPWRMVQACTEEPGPPDLILAIDRSLKMSDVVGHVQAASRLLEGIPLVVVTQRGDREMPTSYVELGASRIVRASELGGLPEVVRDVLRERPRGRGVLFATAWAGSDRLRRSDILRAAADLKSQLWRISDRMWIKDQDLCFVFANDAFAQDMHMAPEQMVGLTDFDVYGPEEGAEYRRQDRQVMAEGRQVDTPGPGRSINRKIPIRDSDGRTVALVLLGTRPRQRRRQMEETLYTMAEVVVSSRDAILVADADGSIRRCNPAATAMYGCPESELTGRHLSELAAPGHREALMSDLQRAVEDYETRCREAEHLTEKGDTVDVSVTTSPVMGPWGELLAISVVARDISEQVRARQGLRASEERFRLMAEAAFDGMSIVEVDAESGRQQLVFCNDRYVEMSGRTERQLRQARDLRTLRSSGAELGSVEALHMLREQYADPAYWQQCRRRLAEGLPVMEIGSWDRPDGEENYHERSCVRVVLDGRHYLYSVDRDVTDTLDRERALKQTLEELALSHNELERLGYAGESQPKVAEPHQADIEQVARRVREDPVGDFDFRAAAEEMHISYAHFRRLFRQYMERPPHDYLLLWRMRKAARALRDPDRPVKSVAHEVGYSDPDQFYKLFKKKIGLSPTDYRKALRRTQHARP